ncbi:MAG: DUF3631 domain-containing protein [Candidatus Nanopelagicales bacterium]|nr:DUF3631 domain-containing protein [Candidatus Nanopelagicales bacterium]
MKKRHERSGNPKDRTLRTVRTVQGQGRRGDQTLRDILDDLEEFISAYAVFPDPHCSRAIALWVVHTHKIDSFDSTPRLTICSAVMGSGKTRVLEILETLVEDPIRAADVSAATLFRVIEKRTPTILLDEYDIQFRSTADSGDSIRGIINAGYRRGSSVLRCVGQSFEPQEFETFAPVCLAGNGDPPATILDRSVVVRLRRRKPSEDVKRWRVNDCAPEGHALRDRIAEWAQRDWQPTYPEDEPGVADRLLDVWEPLLAIADSAGGEWPVYSRLAIPALTETVETESTSVRLLREIRDIWPTGKDWISTREILQGLHQIEEGPWREGGPYGPRGLTPHTLAALLHGYRIKPVHNLKKTLRGYRHGGFADAWDRYLTPLDALAGEPSEASEASGTPKRRIRTRLVNLEDFRDLGSG